MATKDYNGNDENETVRMYESADDMPEPIRGEYGVTDKSSGPFFVKFTADGSGEGLFESLSDALAEE